MQMREPKRGDKTLLLWGSAVTVFFWWIAWSKEIPASQYAFFPLWLGYILTVNGVSEYLYGSSLLTGLGKHFWILFVASAPFWWFFEFLNKFVTNWHYVYERPISDAHYAIETTIDFTVVLPAVMSTIFLFNRIFEARGLRFSGPPFSLRKQRAYLLAGAGVIGLALVMLAPTVAFPLVWVAPVFILESLAFALGYPSLLRKLNTGNYSLVASISAATIFNGIVWELWNYHSSPKWVYTIPYAGFLKIEMPILGYLGYPFFGMIVYDFVVLLLAFIRGGSLAENEISR